MLFLSCVGVGVVLPGLAVSHRSCLLFSFPLHKAKPGSHRRTFRVRDLCFGPGGGVPEGPLIADDDVSWGRCGDADLVTSH